MKKKNILSVSVFLITVLLTAGQVYHIQMGSFSDRGNINTWQLRNAGIEPILVEKTADGMYKVQWGSFEYYWQAWLELEEARKVVPDAFIVKAERGKLKKPAEKEIAIREISPAPEELHEFYVAVRDNHPDSRSVLMELHPRIQRGKSWKLAHLGSFAFRENDLENARHYWWESIKAAGEKPVGGALNAAGSLANLAWREGDRKKALEKWEWLAGAELTSESVLYVADAALRAGRLRQVRREYIPALNHFKYSLQLYRQLGDEKNALEVKKEKVGAVMELAGRARGTYEEAARYAESALAEYSHKSIEQAYATIHLIRTESLWFAGKYNASLWEARVLSQSPWGREAMAGKYWEAKSLIELKRPDEALPILEALKSANVEATGDVFPSLPVSQLAAEELVKIRLMSGEK